ncbi:MAG: hypothetical protein ACW964_19435 [Candidatus Hodarchaeales archaeon]|jgi:hypothetical protein
MLEFIIDPWLPVIILIAGIIGLVYGINKLMKSADDESAFIKYIALGTSIVIGVLNIIAVFEWKIDTVSPDVTTVHWLTILLIFLAGSTMLAAPLKETPLAAIIALLAFGSLAGVFLLIADFNTDFSNPEVLGIINIPLWLVILILVIIVGLVFLATLFTEFTVDRILQLISWAPVVIIFCGLLTIQGLLAIILQDAGGIWALIP